MPRSEVGCAQEMASVITNGLSCSHFSFLLFSELLRPKAASPYTYKLFAATMHVITRETRRNHVLWFSLGREDIFPKVPPFLRDSYLCFLGKN